MTPTSLPVTPTQPNQHSYPISDLNLFQIFGRAKYHAKFGQQAPPYRPQFPIKYWFDSSEGGVYTIVNYNTEPPSLEKITISKAMAGAINLPGDFFYPVYAPSTSTPAVTTNLGVTQPVPVNMICEQADAVKLATAISGPNAPAPTEDPQLNNVTWNGETRRMWDVMVAGTLLVAAPLVAQMYVKGIGAPGKWNLTNPLNPVWVPTPDPDWSTLPTLGCPVRVLLPNESIQAVDLGMAYMVVRSDV